VNNTYDLTKRKKTFSEHLYCSQPNPEAGLITECDELKDLTFCIVQVPSYA
jgi:hypothetical protein